MKKKMTKKEPKKHNCYTCEHADSNEYGFYCSIFGNRFGLACTDYVPDETKEGETKDVFVV